MQNQSNTRKDIIIFYSFRDVEDKLKWFDRMYDVVVDQIMSLESALNSFEDVEDRNAEISKAIRQRMNRKGQGDSDMDNDEDVKEVLVMTAFHETSDSSVPDVKGLVSDLLDNRMKILEIVGTIRSRIRDLKEEIFLNGRAVVLIIDPIWDIFGSRYLYSPIDAKEFFALKGELNISPFIYYDPYFTSAFAAGFGLNTLLDTL